MLVPFHHILQQSLLFYPVMSRAGGTSGERDPFPEHQQLFQSSSRGLCGSALLPFAPCVALCLLWIIPVVSVPLPLVPWGPFAILCNHIYPSVLQKNFPCQQAVSACLPRTVNGIGGACFHGHPAGRLLYPVAKPGKFISKSWAIFDVW